MAPTPVSIESEILRFYTAGQEAERLDSFCRWEKVRTLDLLDRFLPPAPAVILDVGGGAGAYSFPLAEKGYAVDLIDPVPLHIEQARKQAETTPNALRSFHVGDARALPAADAIADAVLLFGPLYHLTEPCQRLMAIAEARRVLRPGGSLLAVAISRFASALDGIARSLIRDPQFVRIMEHDLETGQHRNETGNPDYFTTAYLQHPDEFKRELIEAGFPLVTLYGIEGPLWTVPKPQTTGEHNTLMSIMRTIEGEPALIGASAHIMAVAKKPD
jgi:ubiquinone/menaquinone biosynthesis C-methylase UbiE